MTLVNLEFDMVGKYISKLVINNLNNAKKVLALAAATLATTIYGINHTVAKSVMPVYIGSLGFVLLRVLGATILFWTIGLFSKAKK